MPVASRVPGFSVISRFATPIWLGILAIFAAFILVRHSDDLQLAATIIANSNISWVVAAISAQFVILALIAGKFWSLFERNDASLPPRTVARIHLRRHLIGVVLPFGGPGALVQFVRDLGRHNVSGGTAIRVSLLATIVNEIAFAMFLIPALLWLSISGRLTGAMIAGTGTLTVIFAAGLITAVVLLRRECMPEAISSRLPNKLRHIVSEIQGHGLRFSDIGGAIPYAFGVNLAGLAMMIASLEAVGQYPGLTTILAARIGASLTMLILPIFQGAGAVEVVVIGALHAGGVPYSEAIAAMVIFRVGQFWTPLLLGGLAMLPWEQVNRISWRLSPAPVNLHVSDLIQERLKPLTPAPEVPPI